MCKPGESQTCTPGTSNTLYVNKNTKKLKNKKQNKKNPPSSEDQEQLYRDAVGNTGPQGMLAKQLTVATQQTSSTQEHLPREPEGMLSAPIGCQ